MTVVTFYWFVTLLIAEGLFVILLIVANCIIHSFFWLLFFWWQVLLVQCWLSAVAGKKLEHTIVFLPKSNSKVKGRKKSVSPLSPRFLFTFEVAWTQYSETLVEE